jgi:siroheme synthase-like protein
MSASPYYPAFLDLSRRKCVVFGGGKVALRKVRMLRQFGARVEVVAPELCAEMDALRSDGSIEAKVRRFEPGDLESAFVAIAATDDSDTNERIASEARKRRVLVNVVDVPRLCDFIVPSYLRRGDLTIAISTSGASPSLSKKVRIRLEKEFGEEYSALSKLAGEVRAELKRNGIIAVASDWESALDLDLILDLLKQGKDEEARTTLVSALTSERKAIRHAR